MIDFKVALNSMIVFEYEEGKFLCFCFLNDPFKESSNFESFCFDSDPIC